MEQGEVRTPPGQSPGDDQFLRLFQHEVAPEAGRSELLAAGVVGSYPTAPRSRSAAIFPAS